MILKILIGFALGYIAACVTFYILQKRERRRRKEKKESKPKHLCKGSHYCGIGSWDDPYIVFLCSLMDRHGPGGGCIKHNRQRNRSSIGGLPWNKYDYEHL